MKFKKILSVLFSVLALFSFEMNAQNEFTNAVTDTISFYDVDEKPTFKECQDLVGKENLHCFIKFMNKHIRKNKRYPDYEMQLLPTGRVTISFLIDTEGKVKVLKTRGPDKYLEQQAREIIEKLPPLIPGKHKGKNVVVSMAYPIFFRFNL